MQLCDGFGITIQDFSMLNSFMTWNRKKNDEAAGTVPTASARLFSLIPWQHATTAVRWGGARLKKLDKAGKNTCYWKKKSVYYSG